MFGGQWKESSENTVTLEIPDPNIDQEGDDMHIHTYTLTHIHTHNLWPKPSWIKFLTDLSTHKL